MIIDEELRLGALFRLQGVDKVFLFLLKYSISFLAHILVDIESGLEGNV